MARCKSCGAEIIFIKTRIGGKPMPCDAKQVDYWEGKGDKVMTPRGEVINCTLKPQRQPAAGFGYVSHFATCPAADTFRRK